jgi:hypothetical protein
VPTIRKSSYIHPCEVVMEDVLEPHRMPACSGWELYPRTLIHPCTLEAVATRRMPSHRVVKCCKNWDLGGIDTLSRRCASWTFRAHFYCSERSGGIPDAQWFLKYIHLH